MAKTRTTIHDIFYWKPQEEFDDFTEYIRSCRADFGRDQWDPED